MIRLSKIAVVCLAAVPLAWLLAGCGGDSTTKKKTGSSTTPPKTDEGSDKGTASAKDKDGGGEAKGKDDGSAAAAEGWGTIKGRIVYDGDPPDPMVIAEQGATVMKADPAKEVKDAARCTQHALVSEDLVVNKENKGVKWVVVWISGKPKIHPDLAKAEGEVEFGQEFCHFKPHVLALRQGQKLKVTASDPGIGHNTHITGFDNQWNTVIPAPHEGEKSEVDGPDLRSEGRPFPVKCDIHVWMSAHMAVFNHPYFAVTGDDGSFVIEKVPAGTNKLVIWQESIGWGPGEKTGQSVELKADETTDLGEIKLPKK